MKPLDLYKYWTYPQVPVFEKLRGNHFFSQAFFYEHKVEAIRARLKE